MQHIIQHYGRIDEAFVTTDILSEDQIRNLYCVKIPHTLAAIPKNVGLNVRRRKKGAALAAGDFPTQPVRLYNFSAGSLNDEGSNGQALTNNGGAISVAGVDGSLGNAFDFLPGSYQNLMRQMLVYHGVLQLDLLVVGLKCLIAADVMACFVT